MFWMIRCVQPLDLGAQGDIGLGAGDTRKMFDRMTVSRVALTVLLLEREDAELLSVA
jgi:hypothetical protein